MNGTWSLTPSRRRQSQAKNDKNWRHLGFELWLFPLSAVGPGARYFSCLKLSVIICKQENGLLVPGMVVFKKTYFM